MRNLESEAIIYCLICVTLAPLAVIAAMSTSSLSIATLVMPFALLAPSHIYNAVTCELWTDLVYELDAYELDDDGLWCGIDNDYDPCNWCNGAGNSDRDRYPHLPCTFCEGSGLERDQARNMSDWYASDNFETHVLGRVN
jgi:hypothetical protein